MPDKHIVFSTERLPTMLLEAASLLLKIQALNKQNENVHQSAFYLNQRKKLLNEKIDNWIETNIVTE